ncbi:MAG: hypothetical protein K6E50_10055 [Lachnospiraceae bacterium]|nr:hypothetical protein [Lachnospiraceae bacterium]
MKKRIMALTVLLAACVAGCSNADEQKAANKPDQQEQTADKIDNAESGTQNGGTTDNNQQGDISQQIPDFPEEMPSVNVAVIDEKRANITVHANGGEYFGYSLEMIDPALADAGNGNYYQLMFDNPDGSGYACHLIGYRDWNVDYIASNDVPFEDYGKGDYLFKVTLPDSDAVSFYSIDEYRLNVRLSASDSTFQRAGNFPYTDVCQFMDEDAAMAARNNGSAGGSATSGNFGKLSPENSDRVAALLGEYPGDYQNSNKRVLSITGEYGTYQLWPSFNNFNEKIEVHCFNDNDQGDDAYSAHMTLENDNRLVIECEGRPGYSSEGKQVLFVFDNCTVSVTCDGVTEEWSTRD